MSNDLISIIPENYPNRLLLGSESYKFNFSVVNNSNSNETLGISLSADGLEFSTPKEFKKPFKINSSGTTKFSVEIKPTIDGKTKLMILVNQQKKTTYLDKEWQARNSIERDILDKTLSVGAERQIDHLLIKNKLPSISETIENLPKNNIEQQVNDWINSKTADISEEKRDYINIKLLELAETIFNSKPEYAFTILESIEDSVQKKMIVVNFILAYAQLNHQSALKKIYLIKDGKEQQDVIQRIIYGIALEHTKEAIDLVENVTDPRRKDQILTNLIYLYCKKDIDASLILIKNLNNEILQAELYLEIARYLFETRKPDCISILEKVVQITAIADSDLLVRALILLGSLKTPKESIDIIESLPEGIRGKIHDHLKQILYSEVEVEKTRYEPIPILSTYFTFNSILKSNPILEKFIQFDGNLSDNLIRNELTSFIGLISLFKFNFPIYPIIERCYEEIHNEKNRSFYYLIIPMESNIDEAEKLVEDMISFTFKKNMQMIKSNIFIFNLDFIPYLSKPTIILSDSDENLLIKSIVDRIFSDKVSLIIDDGLFKGGQLHDNLVKILPDTKFKIINLVMTFDFLNDYSLLKKFLGEFIK